MAKAGRLCYFGASMSVSIYRYADATMPTVHGPLRAIVYRHKRADGSADSANQTAGASSPRKMSTSPSSLASYTAARMCCVGCTPSAGPARRWDRSSATVDSSWMPRSAITEAGRGSSSTCGRKVAALAWATSCAPMPCKIAASTPSKRTRPLGFAADLRSYELAAAILSDLGVRSVALLTNNPDKLRELADAGIIVTTRAALGHGKQTQSGLPGGQARKLGHAR